jgi:uroporphyrinogen decarboxylase
MSQTALFGVTPDWEGLLACITRTREPERVHHIELYLDGEVKAAIVKRFNLAEGLDLSRYEDVLQLEIRIQSFLGYDYVRWGIEGLDMQLNWSQTVDSANLTRNGGRNYINEHAGPITSWEAFEKYPWPDVTHATTRALEWFETNLPDNMCVIGSGGFAHHAEYLNWLMGYETLCIALYEERDLVRAISDKLIAMYDAAATLLLQFDRVKIIWGSDDMGFRSGTLISPKDLREFVLPGHKSVAALSHAAGRPYLLHSCGKLDMIMEDLIEDVRIDAKHSFEDTIESVIETKKKYGNRIAMLGGIDVDFMCRSNPDQIRARVKETLDACLPGGGYVLGTGNSVCNYIPVDHYLTMMEAGSLYQV